MTILAWKYNICKIQVQYKIYANLQIDCLWVPYHKAKRKIYRLHLKLSLGSLRNNNGDGYENIT